ncbi:unnamed protein product, partial [Dracunculus medinensis]|uniref:PKD_channel domain-containing protein n=1 Tax=Dracunculus medinensis TaxID=318479 RepID=A0A0N4ULK5_DRAME
YYFIQDDTFASFSYDIPLSYQRSEANKEFLEGSNATAPIEISFNEIPPPVLCIDRIANVAVYNHTYEFNISDIHDCFLLNLTENEIREIQKEPLSLKEFFTNRGITFKPEDALIISKAVLSFNLRTIHFSPVSSEQRPECYLISVAITFDNSRHTGQVYISLSSVISLINLCNGRVLKGTSLANNAILTGTVDIFVLLLCIASLILCCRALIRAHLLKKDFDSDLFTATGVLLGIGAFLVYMGILRYFGLFSKYNILILTMKKSLPNILRFMSCAAVLYLGFLIAGWIIIGPYNIKFRTLVSSSEALFSLLNGDDMFATFFTINTTNPMVKLIGTIYIYVFVSLFIYVVLSLFIAIIMDAYEVVKVSHLSFFVNS